MDAGSIVKHPPKGHKMKKHQGGWGGNANLITKRGSKLNQDGGRCLEREIGNSNVHVFQMVQVEYL